MITESRQLNQVSVGIGMVIVSVTLMLTLVLAFFSGLILGVAGTSPEIAMTLSRWVGRLTVPVLATSQALGTIGPCLCLAAPPQAKATEFVLASVALSALSTALVALGYFISLAVWLTLIVTGLPFLAMVAFVFFIRRLSHYLGRDDIGKIATQSIVLGGMGGISWIVMQLFDPDGLGTVSVVIQLGALLLLLVAFLRYVRALQYSRKAIQSVLTGDAKLPQHRLAAIWPGRRRKS